MIVTLLATGMLFMQDQPTASASQATARSAETPGQSGARAAAGSEENPGDRMVCRREHVMGSNRPQRICMTERQRAQQSETARDQLNRRSQQGRGEDVSGVGDVY